MDELLHHCLRELAFDGDLGCNTSRLRDFIYGFYAHNNALHAQNLDDSFCACVWSLLVQQPTVQVGLVPEGVNSEVWIAPQPSAKKKGQPVAPQQLDQIPDSKSTPLKLLVERHGDRLRIAAEPNTIFAAITGSHVRSPRMSPMVYTALQIVTRGRDGGVSVVDLGKRSGYDQKACFYLVKQLTDMDLVLKVRRGGVSSNFVIHKYFFERSSTWNAIRNEENEAENSSFKGEPGDSDSEDDADAVAESRALNFTPIDARHLSSFPIISGRVIKLLKTSKNHMHVSKNMIMIVGFSRPTKADRRFFTSMMNEMVQKGLIEKVLVPSARQGSQGDASVKCFRLIEGGEKAMPAMVEPQLEPPQEEAAFATPHGRILMNATVPKQIVDLIASSGTNGMTLNDIEASLNGFDRRVLEELLSRCERTTPPSHLLDLHIIGLMENQGRERRHKYYTVRNYRKLVADEGLDESEEASAFDLRKVGGFSDAPAEAFYGDEEDLASFYDSLPLLEDHPKANSNKTSKNPILPNGSVKRGRPRKKPEITTKIRKNPILPDGTVKKGRPRKNPAGENESVTTRLAPKRIPKRKRAETEEYIEDQEEEPSIKKARIAEETLHPPKHQGRPPKSKPENLIIPERSPHRSRVYVEIISPKRKSMQKEPSPQPSPVQDVTMGGTGDNGEELQLSPSTERMRPPSVEPPVEVPTGDFGTPESPRRGLRNRKASWKVAALDTLISMPPLSSPPRSTPRERKNTQALPCAPSGDRLTHPDPRSPPTSPTRNMSLPKSFPASSRVNVSHLRRESELMQLLEKAGGIVGTHSKEIFDDHMKLLEDLAKSGEPASAPPGTRTDKRTLNLTFESMERKGKVKLLKTSVTLPTGLNRATSLVYLPYLDEATVHRFLDHLSCSSHPRLPQLTAFTKLDQSMEYGSIPRGGKPALQLRQFQVGSNAEAALEENEEQAETSVTVDDENIRDAFLADRTTLQQLYGYTLARALRCRQLHLGMVQALELAPPSSNVVSCEKRIIEMSYLLFDLPLQLYCSIVAPNEHNEDLLAALADDTKRQTPVREMPSLYNVLNVAKARARSRFLEMLEMLHALRLVTALCPATSDEQLVTCSPNDRHPTRFEAAPTQGWSQTSTAPSYWMLHEIAPIHLWAISDTEPPLWKTNPVIRSDDVKRFWDDLHNACTNPEIQVDGMSDGEITLVGHELGRSLRRDASWRSNYRLSESQMRYLRQKVDIDGKTPLDALSAVDKDTTFKRLSWVTCAPLQVIESYLTAHGRQVVNDVEKLKERMKHVEDTRASLAQKAEEARTQRESDWTVLLSKIHPDELPPPAAIRIDRVRKRYLKAGSVKDEAKWEKEIQAALHETNLASTKGLRIVSKHSTFKPLYQAPALSLPQPSGTSISDLIERQGPPIDHDAASRKRRRKATTQEIQVPQKRRHRFQWNAEYDELARDASVIIRARCRHLKRLDWAAFEQAFPAVPRNTVRQRLTNIRESPGDEAYLRRLEDVWYDMWLKHRGTEELPDDDTQSASNFDLVEHIQFLRSHIDKHSLRVGLAQHSDKGTVALPASIQQLEAHYQIVERELTAPAWDWMWNTTIEESREKKLKRHAFSRFNSAPPNASALGREDLSVAEAAVKMVMGAPPERYDPENAASLLKSLGDEPVSIATRNLLGRGVLAKLIRDPKKPRPGRTLKISEPNQNALGGCIEQDTFQDAALLLEELDISDDSWREWPLAATDGDCAALIQLTSQNQVEFSVDTSAAQAARPALDWNSKKADDDQMETAIKVRYHLEQEVEPFQASVGSLHFLELPMSTGHGLNEKDQDASCRARTHNGLVDCSVCLDVSWKTLQARFQDDDQRTIAKKIFETTHLAKEAGVRKADLLASCSITGNPQHLCIVLETMFAASIPLVFWAGYDQLVLVSAHYAVHWTVIAVQDPLTRIAPRRWLDLKGQKITDFWQTAVRAVMSTVVFRPGISQSEICWRLRAVYDKQEVMELLRYLSDEGHLKVRLGDTVGVAFIPFDENEEAYAHWFVGEKQWYLA